MFILFLFLIGFHQTFLFASEKDAVRYAIKHAKKPYPSNYFYKKGKDCANFISHALKSGSVLVNHGKTSSLEWVNAEALYKSLIKNKQGELLAIFPSKNNLGGIPLKKKYLKKISIKLTKYLLKLGLKEGDLIFSDWGDDNNPDIDHVVMVTAIHKGLIKVSGHSKDVRNITLKQYLYWVKNIKKQKFSHKFIKVNYPKHTLKNSMKNPNYLKNKGSTYFDFREFRIKL